MSDTTKWMLLLHTAATLSLVGLIWFVQIVHYPLFSRVGYDQFRRYEMEHQRLTTWVVGPLMLLELGTALALLWYQPSELESWLVWLGLVLIAAIWLMTYSIQVPQHAALVFSYDSSIQKELVAGNWYRTVAWTARGGLVLWMLGQMMSSSTSQEAVSEIAKRL